MLTYNPERRVSAAEANKHDWFEGKDFNKLSPEAIQELITNMNQFYVSHLLILDCR